MSTLEQTGARFQTTNWDDLDALRNGGSEVRRELTEKLVRQYWPPVYAYLRQRGHSADEATELTQAFFVEVVLGRALFERADLSQGRLRALFLTAIKRFAIDKHRRRSARGSSFSLAEDALAWEEARRRQHDSDTVDNAFDRRWAVSLLEEALRRCEFHFQDAGRGNHWRIFEERIIRPAANRTQPPPLHQAAVRYGFATPGMASAAVQTVKRRLEILLREVVAETVRDTATVDEELAIVKSSLRS